MTTVMTEADMTMPIVQLEGVSKSYAQDSKGDVVLRDLNLTITRGQKVSLIGPSGCGKSTLLLLIAGLLRPDAGTISIDALATSHLDDGARAGSASPCSRTTWSPS
jgi:ABC-type Fe3+/spermidine/putrescine transport system ATPase subunit